TVQHYSSHHGRTDFMHQQFESGGRSRFYFSLWRSLSDSGPGVNQRHGRGRWHSFIRQSICVLCPIFKPAHTVRIEPERHLYRFRDSDWLLSTTGYSSLQQPPALFVQAGRETHHLVGTSYLPEKHI